MNFFNKKIFTLIELLVVIAILSILMTLLMPSLSKAREKAKDIGCKGNMKQMGVLFMNYSADFDGLLPAVVATSDWNSNWLNTLGRLYLKSDFPVRANDVKNMTPETIFQCPGRMSAYNGSDVRGSLISNLDNSQQSGYGMSWNTTKYQAWTTDPPWYKLSSMAADTFIIMDISSASPVSAQSSANLGDLPLDDIRGGWTRHGYRPNFLFVGGNVQGHKRENTFRRWCTREKD